MPDEIIPPDETPKAPTPDQPTPHPLDALLAAEEADIQALLAEGVTVEEKPAVEETPPEKTVEQVIAETKPPVETEIPPAEQPPVEVKPVAETPPKKEQQSLTWKALRDTERRAKAAEQRIRELEAAPPEKTATTDEEPEIEDPVTKISKKVETLEQNQLAGLLVQEIERDEANFTKDHPDYKDALNFLAKTEREEYDAAGILDIVAADVIEKRPDLVEQVAMATGKTEEEAAKDIAFNSTLQARRQMLITSARKAGKSIADVAYKIARSRGFKSTPAQPQPTPQEVKAAEARQRVEQAKKSAPASQSLSALTTSGGSPKDWRPQTRDEVLNLTDDQIAKLDQEDPHWLENL